MESWQERELAAQIARGVRGVKDVRNTIEVELDRPRADTELEAEINARIQNDVHLSGKDVAVDVQAAKAFLSGSVGSAMAKQWAIADAWVMGVESVDASQLKVQPQWPSAAAVGDAQQQARRDQQSTGAPAGRSERDTGVDRQERTRVREQSAATKQRTNNVQRSDSQLRSSIAQALNSNPRLSKAETQVSVNNGVATLSGTVDHLKAKQVAAGEARGVSGVRRVQNNIKVRPDKEYSDKEIADNVRQALLLDPWVERFEMKVSARNGKVFLSGDVDSAFEKSRAEDIASRTKGVVAIQNSLRVPDYTWNMVTYYPPLPAYYGYTSPLYSDSVKTDAEIRENIEDEMFWSPFVDADEVDVSVKDGVATLTGSVDDWYERSKARENAYEGGAIRVRDQLSVYDDWDGPLDF